MALGRVRDIAATITTRLTSCTFEPSSPNLGSPPHSPVDTLALAFLEEREDGDERSLQSVSEIGHPPAGMTTGGHIPSSDHHSSGLSFLADFKAFFGVLGGIPLPAYEVDQSDEGEIDFDCLFVDNAKEGVTETCPEDPLETPLRLSTSWTGVDKVLGRSGIEMLCWRSYELHSNPFPSPSLPLS